MGHGLGLNGLALTTHLLERLGMETKTSATRSLDTSDLIEKLASHLLYAHLADEESLRTFMRAHVFCVWDFQSLLKALQRSLTCVEIPWMPTADPEARRLINEIVLDEESDVAPEGQHLSHFELYVLAMRRCGAATGEIDSFLALLRRGVGLEQAMASLPRMVSTFVRTTMEVARSGEAHRIAAVFAYGREDIIPAMFRRVVEQLAGRDPGRWSTFLYYLDRHIGSDEDRHGPFARAVVARLCGEQERLWQEAQASARTAVEARIRLWDEILEVIVSGRDRRGG
ncbi:MAG: DUF3050 domain-containing protein [Tepidisphaeraceae bacterium]